MMVNIMTQSDTNLVDGTGLNEKLENPIFVTGYMHSGTTLTQKVLGGHEQVFAGGGETRHFSHLSVIERRYPDLKDEDVLTEYVTYLLQVICTGYARVNLNGPGDDSLEVIESCGLTSEDINQLASLAEQNRDYATLLGTAYDYLTAKAGKQRWLDKSPDYMSYLDKILTLYPGGKVVIIVRDPRDILASKLRRTKKSGNYDPVWDSLAWRGAVRAGERAKKQYPDKVTIVRYEDLVTEPRATIQRLCEFLDLEYSDDMLSVSWINTSTTGLEGSGIGTGAMGKWRNVLQPEDVYLCQRLAKGEMAENGYEAEEVSSAVLMKSPLIVGRSIGELARRFYKEWAVERRDNLPDMVDYYRARFKALSKTEKSGTRSKP